MDNNYEPNTGNPEYSLTDILTEYYVCSASKSAKTPQAPAEQRSREIVMEAPDEQVAAADITSGDIPEETAEPKRQKLQLPQLRLPRFETKPKGRRLESAEAEENRPAAPEGRRLAEPEGRRLIESVGKRIFEPEGRRLSSSEGRRLAEAQPSAEPVRKAPSEPEVYSITEILAEAEAIERLEHENALRRQAETQTREKQLAQRTHAEAVKAAAEAAAPLPEMPEEALPPAEAEAQPSAPQAEAEAQPVEKKIQVVLVDFETGEAQSQPAEDAEEQPSEENAQGVLIDFPTAQAGSDAFSDADETAQAVAIEPDGADRYAGADYPEMGDPGAEDGAGESELSSADKKKRPGLLVMLTAILVLRRKRRMTKMKAEDKAAAEREALPEVSAKAAAKYYLKNSVPYKLRFLVAAALCMILLYVSWGLPLVGAMRNIRVCAGMCLVLELGVMLLALDVFTKGIVNLFRGKPGLESLLSVSCIFSALDAVIIFAGGPQRGLPYCAVSSVGLCIALLGERLYCIGMARTLHTAGAAKEPNSVFSVEGAVPDGRVLIRSKRSVTGFVNRSQEADPVTLIYNAVAPILLIAAPVLAFVATVCCKQSSDFFHCLSALTAVSSSFSALLCYTLPFAVVSRRLAVNGAAIAGWSGCADVGESRSAVLTDEDVFPVGNVLIDTIRILEGVYTDKVLSYAGSVVAFSGCGLVPAFTDLMRRNGCAMHRVENFSCHRGGGLTGIVRGEQVLIGSSSFMNLMGIRLPQSQMSKSSVFIAISGELVGVFSIRYVPAAAVQEALVSLLRSRAVAPLFAIRDFNVTPLLIKQRYRMPTEGFDFPSFQERYRISAIEPGEHDQPSMLLVRKGVGTFVEAAAAGRGLFRCVRLCLVLSLLCSVLGMLLMFFLCIGASYDSASAGNILLYLLFWLVPVIFCTLGLRR
ncbi:MAG: hypothetical protein IKK00_06395 [Oscillospiraceae bacterium]|nr:hypothetical protein [Oscillospiraceae bacterium]